MVQISLSSASYQSENNNMQIRGRRWRDNFGTSRFTTKLNLNVLFVEERYRHQTLVIITNTWTIVSEITLLLKHISKHVWMPAKFSFSLVWDILEDRCGYRQFRPTFQLLICRSTTELIVELRCRLQYKIQFGNDISRTKLRNGFFWKQENI